MQIQVDAKSVLAGPFEGLDDVPVIRSDALNRITKCEDAYFQHVLSKNGSSSSLSMAQKGMGNRM